MQSYYTLHQGQHTCLLVDNICHYTIIVKSLVSGRKRLTLILDCCPTHFWKKDPNGTSDRFFSMLLIYSPLSIKINQRFLQPCDKTEPWNFVMKSSHLPNLIISITVDAQQHKLLSEFLKSCWWKQIWVVYSSSFAQFGHIFVSFFSLSIDWKPENYWVGQICVRF